MVLIDPAKPGKIREVVNVTGPLRRIQDRLYRQLLLPNHRPSYFVTAALVVAASRQTLGRTSGRRSFIRPTSPTSTQAFTILASMSFSSTDSVAHPDVSHIDTKLCTFRHHLTRGLITSPILADYLMNGTGQQNRKDVHKRWADLHTVC